MNIIIFDHFIVESDLCDIMGIIKEMREYKIIIYYAIGE